MPKGVLLSCGMTLSLAVIASKIDLNIYMVEDFHSMWWFAHTVMMQPFNNSMSHNLNSKTIDSINDCEYSNLDKSRIRA